MKVYLRGGAQLVSPDDVRIEEAIAAAPPAIRIDTARDPDNPRTWPADVLQSYLDRAGQLADAGAAAAAAARGDHPDARRRRRDRRARHCISPVSPTCTWCPSRPRRTATSPP